eukprot:scaffold79846_cov75-Phaeocystis_antarctica.AAC.1
MNHYTVVIILIAWLYSRSIFATTLESRGALTGWGAAIRHRALVNQKGGESAVEQRDAALHASRLGDDLPPDGPHLVRLRGRVRGRVGAEFRVRVRVRAPTVRSASGAAAGIVCARVLSVSNG